MVHKVNTGWSRIGMFGKTFRTWGELTSSLEKERCRCPDGLHGGHQQPHGIDEQCYPFLPGVSWLRLQIELPGWCRGYAKPGTPVLVPSEMSNSSTTETSDGCRARYDGDFSQQIFILLVACRFSLQPILHI